MNNSNLEAFYFHWYCVQLPPRGCGYYSNSTIDADTLWIDFTVDGKPYRLDLNGRIGQFVEGLDACGIASWNDKCFDNPHIFDGYSWELEITYQGKNIRARGSNGYPKEFPAFMQFLHQMGLPYSALFGKSWMDYIPETEISPYPRRV